MTVASKIEHVPLAKLKGYDKNARTHSPAQVEQLAAAIREFGFTNPIGRRRAIRRPATVGGLTEQVNARIFPHTMRITLELDPEVIRIFRYGIKLLEEANRRLAVMAQQERELASKVAASAQGTKNAFEAIKGVMATQAASLKEALDKIAAGADNDDPEVLALLNGVQDSLTGTNADMLAAAQLAGTPAASQVPQPAADAAAANANQPTG